MHTYFFDLETNGFLEQLTKVHCLGYARDDDPVDLLTDDESMYSLLAQWEDEGVLIVGHNIIAFDIPALMKVFNFDSSKVRILDTLVMARFIFPDTAPEDDKLILKGKLPARLMGSHSLEAWGYRLGEYKGDYNGGWETYSEEMGVYCKQDVVVTRKLYYHCMAQEPAQEALELEHAVQTIVQRQVRFGVGFNVDAALMLNAQLNDRLVQLEGELKATYGSFYKAKKTREGEVKVLTPEKDSKRLGYVAGAPFSVVELVEFNPGSRAHIVHVLLKDGWKPEKFTDTGNPKVDEEVLEELAKSDQFKTAKLLITYLLLKKRLGQLADGTNGWLKLVRNGRIHGSVNTNGAVTGRMTHSNPNLAQVPSVKKGKNEAGEEVVLYGEAGGWGYEMRDLFCVPKGKKLVGCDASGLELRMLGHYMGRYDNGDYANEVVNGDIHTKNQLAAGLPTRSNAKTFIFSWDDLRETARLKLCELRGPPERTILSQAHTNGTSI